VQVTPLGASEERKEFFVPSGASCEWSGA